MLKQHRRVAGTALLALALFPLHSHAQSPPPPSPGLAQAAILVCLPNSWLPLAPDQATPPPSPSGDIGFDANRCPHGFYQATAEELPWEPSGQPMRTCSNGGMPRLSRVSNTTTSSVM